VLARAPSKLILLGEHSVVYGHPAVAVPLRSPMAEAEAVRAEGPVRVDLEDLCLSWTVGKKPEGRELEAAARIVELAGVPRTGWRLSVRSKIPLGCGMGSGAAVATAAFRAIFGCFGIACAPDRLSGLVYEVERLHHGSPSGIDNTVVAMERPVLFTKGKPPVFLSLPEEPCRLVVGYTGIRHRTAEVVADVARSRSSDPASFDAMFSEMGAVARQGAQALRKGDLRELGGLMDRNQGLLARIGVSSPELDRLIAAARSAGALGAKLSGAGRGGCMVALADGPELAGRLRAALEAAGAAMAMESEALEAEHGEKTA